MLKFSNRRIPFGRQGTVETLRAMAELTESAQLDPITRSTALRILGLAKNPQQFAERVRRWVKAHMLLVDEPVEMIARPEWMLTQIGRTRLVGDCDDAAVLAGALILALGIPVRYVAIANPERPGDFIHVYPEALTSGAWQPFDPTTDRKAPPDWPRLEFAVT
jgi:transglutaminase-like putative cysteine protease